MLVINGYPMVSVGFWILAILVITLIINFLNFIIETSSSEKELSYLPTIPIAASLVAINYFNLTSFTTLLSRAVSSVYKTPALIAVPLVILIVLYSVKF